MSFLIKQNKQEKKTQMHLTLWTMRLDGNRKIGHCLQRLSQQTVSSKIVHKAFYLARAHQLSYD